MLFRWIDFLQSELVEFLGLDPANVEIRNTPLTTSAQVGAGGMSWAFVWWFDSLFLLVFVRHV